jgi:predicted SAM-dependent methyltransferase
MIPGFGFLNKKKPKAEAPAAQAERLAPPAAPDQSAEELLAAKAQPFLLNLGCGACFHHAWVNVDFTSNSPDVIAHDLRRGAPAPDASASVVYHSHVLEHFRPEDARRFLRECWRVLIPGGIARVVIPDLETIARLYLRNLELAAGGDANAGHRHQWMTIELVDQLSREHSGGEMLKYWKQNPMPEETFVVDRMGREVLRFLEYFRSAPPKPEPPLEDAAEKIGAFRLGGEPHKWMYDRVSLKRELERAGFEEASQKRADESDIPNFQSYGLDLHSDGSIRKPDSLFMEGRKPKTPA